METADLNKKQMLFPCHCRTRTGVQPKMENQNLQKTLCGKIPENICHLFESILQSFSRLR